MKNRTVFTKFIQLWGIIFLIGISGSIIITDTVISYRDFNVRADQIRADYTARQKQIIKQEVERAVDMIHYEKAQSEMLTKSKIKSRVYEAYAIAQHIYQENKTSKSEHEIQQMIIDAIRPIRFEKGNGYYFISRFDGVAMLFPSKPESEGVNLLDVRDSHGQYITKDVIKIVEQSGEGFYEYHWFRPHAVGNNFKKISFIKRLGFYDWFIGTGLYLDDVESQIKADLLSTISRIRFEKEGYIFVNRLNGDALVSNGNIFSGEKKLWEVFNKNPEKMKNIFRKEYNAALKPEGDYIYYSHIKLTDPNKESPKVSFICGIPELQWLVGAGVYIDDVETVIARMQTELNNQIKMKMLYFTLIAAGIVAFFLFLLSRLNHRLKKDFNLFISFFNRAALSDEPIDRDKVEFDELERMADNANRMLADRRLAEDALLVSEEKYRMLFENASDAIFVAQDEKVIFPNPQLSRLLGYSYEELNGVPFKNFIHPDDADMIVERHRKRLKGETVPGTYSFRAVTKSGEILWVEVSKVLITWEGRPATLSFLRDITQQKKLEEQLLHAQKMEAIGTLAGGVAHDFNNLLMGILGYTSLMLMKTDKSHPFYEKLKTIEKQVESGAELTKQLLGFARGGKYEVKPINVNDLIIKTSEIFGKTKKEITIHKKLQEDLHSIEADTGQIEQVLFNLYVNAWQAMPTGGRLYLETQNVNLDERQCRSYDAKKPGPFIKITVTDTGVGMDAKTQKRIFEPFFSTKGIGKGTGLGLASAYGIIRNHQGIINVYSEKGHGTTFTVFLPASGAKAAETKATEGSLLTGHETILIVDDEPINIEAVKELLEVLGYKILTAQSGKEAIELYGEHLGEIQLVILDMIMPEMNGRKTLIRLMEIDKNVRVLLASGYSINGEAKTILELGCKGFIQKPFRPEVLSQKIREVLDRGNS
jgi:PAS domain S-box-containing protein